jgi:hypothetical protein
VGYEDSDLSHRVSALASGTQGPSPVWENPREWSRKAPKISCNFFPHFSQYTGEDVTTKTNALNSINIMKTKLTKQTLSSKFNILLTLRGEPKRKE